MSSPKMNLFHRISNKIIYLCKYWAETVCMNRIKEESEIKGVRQSELANRLCKLFNRINMYTMNKIQSVG